MTGALYEYSLDPATPTPCPFNDAYYFRYSDHVTGSCDQTISYAKPCVGHTKYLLHFKQCSSRDLVVLDRGRGQSRLTGLILPSQSCPW